MIKVWILETFVPWLATNGLRIVIIIAVAMIVIRIANFAIKKTVRRLVSSKGFASKVGEQRREDTLIALFTATLRIIVWIVVITMMLSEFGVDIAPLLAGAGIAGVALGFGAQYLVRDIINGIFIIFENQFKVGDVICANDQCGTVERVTLRVTTIRDIDGIVHHMPNGELKVVSNQTQNFSRVNMNIGIAYNSDIDEVEKVINELGETLAQDPAWKDKITEPLRFVRINSFDDSDIKIKILGTVTPGDQWDVAGEFRRRLKVAFEKKGISIPFPQREMHIIKESA